MGYKRYVSLSFFHPIIYFASTIVIRCQRKSREKYIKFVIGTHNVGQVDLKGGFILTIVEFELNKSNDY